MEYKFCCSAYAHSCDCYFNDIHFSSLARTRAARARQDQASPSTSAAPQGPTAPQAPAAAQAPAAPQAVKVYVIRMYFRAV